MTARRTCPPKREPPASATGSRRLSSRRERWEAFRLFLDGEPKPEGYNEDWLDEVRVHVDSGRRMYRVHVVTRPLTPYLRYELGWGCTTNSTAGEEFFILDVTEHPDPLGGVGDFWLFDSRTAAPMRYTPDGEFAGADVLPDDRAEEYAAYRDTALAHAVPFAEWWATHGD
ncbi:DUF6879 family protein [Streptomyces sp. NPDC059452]|uniref:DUF6879 family protein n=1 Tax=Streptomyces sp. NPDC059452 TaxID=3346835 RepID=UPI0036B021C8